MRCLSKPQFPRGRFQYRRARRAVRTRATGVFPSAVALRSAPWHCAARVTRRLANAHAAAQRGCDRRLSKIPARRCARRAFRYLSMETRRVFDAGLSGGALGRARRAVRSRSAGRSRERDTFLSHYAALHRRDRGIRRGAGGRLQPAPVSGSLSAVRQLSRRRRVPVATLYEQPFCPAGISRSNRCRAAVFGALLAPAALGAILRERRRTL